MAHYFRDGLSLTGDDAELLAALKAIAIKYQPSLFNPNHDKELHQFVVLSLQRLLRDAPPKGSTELHHALAFLKADASPYPGVKPPETSTALSPSPINKKRAQMEKSSAPTPPEKQEKMPNTPNFTVHTKGEYTVRVSEGDSPSLEFSMTGPATIQVKTATPSSHLLSPPQEHLNDNNHGGVRSGRRPCGAVPGTFHSMGPNDPTPAPCCASKSP
ncbi:hypothetical protein B0T20DRAFT_365203 [Sordaria brevicollis]|uniref:Uncharacterized protein n=1 Tax=Sordaria brevicollis TaxID=83679 RepID=A0AAE0NVA9_SORBR|nr:hypothetical protein B0T20DRAFT_365203 [Sordaria brevicollis]